MVTKINGSNASTAISSKAMNCIFTVDVEEWFHILDLPNDFMISQWESLPSSVEVNFLTLLDLFGKYHVRTTCFFLGSVAAKYPHLVREASRQGHEIASHGYSHALAYKMSPAEFLSDIRQAKDVLEQILGERIIGYRAPGFSATNETPWFFEKLAEAAYQYDSSIFPARRAHGGMAHARREPHPVRTSTGAAIFEFPISVVEVLSARVCLFGGGYLRLSPWRLTKAATQLVLKEGRPAIFYVHPREIDPNQPRIPMSAVRRFRSYVNLATTRVKIENIVKEFQFTTFRDLLEEHWPEFAVPKKAPVPATVSLRSATGGEI